MFNYSYGSEYYGEAYGSAFVLFVEAFGCEERAGSVLVCDEY